MGKDRPPGHCEGDPILPDHTFDPEFREVDSEQANIVFTATKGYQASGTITDAEGKRVKGITVTFEALGSEHEQYDPVVTDVDGKWVCSGLVETVRVIPVSDEYRFEPEYYDLDGPNKEVNFAAYIKIFAGGTGSQSLPFEIETPEQLSQVRNYLDKYFILTADLDLSTFSAEQGWEPIGTAAEPFMGALDGGGHKITNLRINRPDETSVGLFGEIQHVRIVNLHLEGVEVCGSIDVGALAGSAIHSRIENCSASGVINGSRNTGGLVGSASMSTISSCETTTDITGTGAGLYIGGLVGNSTGSSYSYSYSLGSVAASGNNVGGLIGVDSNGEYLYCYAQGNVKASVGESSYVGGLIGASIETQVSICFATGSVKGFDNVGGLVGSLSSSAVIADCFAAGQVEGRYNKGGLAGANYGQISNCYAIGDISEPSILTGGLVGVNDNSAVVSNSFYDEETTGQNDTGKGEPKTTAEMMQQETYTGWDFGETWDIDEGVSYPYLKRLPNPYF